MVRPIEGKSDFAIRNGPMLRSPCRGTLTGAGSGGANARGYGSRALVYCERGGCGVNGRRFGWWALVRGGVVDGVSCFGLIGGLDSLRDELGKACGEGVCCLFSCFT